MKTIYIRRNNKSNKSNSDITIVSEFDQSASVVRYAFSVCDKRDVFVKRLGRSWANHRFSSLDKLLGYYDRCGAFVYTGDISFDLISDEIKYYVNRHNNAIKDKNANRLKYIDDTTREALRQLQRANEEATLEPLTLKDKLSLFVAKYFRV